MYRCENKTRQRLAKKMTIGKTISIRFSFGSLKLKFANYACELKHPDYLEMTKQNNKKDYILFIRAEIKKMKKLSIMEFSESICEKAFQNLSKE